MFYYYLSLDASIHGTTKLVAYFSVLSHCIISRIEKRMVSQGARLPLGVTLSVLYTIFPSILLTVRKS